MDSYILRTPKATLIMNSIYDFCAILHEPGSVELNQLFSKISNERIYDTLYQQLKGLIKTKNPSVTFSDEEMVNAIEKYLNGKSIMQYGNWAYYSWSERLVHILPEEEFAFLRTNRNRNKISAEEQQQLSTKRIGVIGLSVGQSSALALAMERSFGELRIADFDELELSNLNRIRAGVHNLGLNKAIATAREIAEIDPYLKVTCFTEGITDNNIDRFLTEGGKLDILVEECDSLNIKIKARQKAKALGIPVIMDTSDGGMLDIERFDLEPSRPLFHGRIEHLDTTNLSGLTNEEKIPFVTSILGSEEMTERMKASFAEIGKTISTWPQLASSVFLGGALGSNVARRILLDQLHASGRYHVDPDTIITDDNTASNTKVSA